MHAIDLTPPAVVSAGASTALSEAVRLMREHGVGDLVITRGDGSVNEPVGLVTDRDIVVHAFGNVRGQRKKPSRHWCPDFGFYGVDSQPPFRRCRRDAIGMCDT